MSQVKVAARMLKGQSLEAVKAPVPPSPLKDSLKDDLIKKPDMKAAPGDETESLSARTKSTRAHMKTFIEDAKRQVIETGGAERATYDAFADTVGDALDPASAAAATKELMMEVQATDKRVARSFVDTVEGHGGGAWIAPKLPVAAGRDEEEEEEEEAAKPAEVAPTVDEG